MVEAQTSSSNEFQNMISDQAFLYFPGVNGQKTPDGIRRIFNGNVKYDDFENKMLGEFKKHCAKQAHTPAPIWDDARLLRFLQANHWKLEKTLNAIKENDTCRSERIPVQKTPFLEEFLHKGIMYVHGRDRHFRPIIVFNAYMIDPKKSDADDLINGLTYFFEFLIANILLPGQVENWVFILDLNNVGIGSLPKSALKKIISYLQSNYRGHLWTMNIINTPSSIYIPWTIAKSFLDEVTVKKIQFFKTGVPKTLFDFTNKEQVEQKFGGTAKNLTRFWPPTFPSDNYLLPTDDPKTMLISKKEYSKLYKADLLKEHKVNHSLLVLDEVAESNSPIRATTTSDPLELVPLTLTQSLPVKRVENRATAMGDVLVRKFSFSKDDNDMEEDFDIKFMDEDMHLRTNVNVGGQRAPKKMMTCFQSLKK